MNSLRWLFDALRRDVEGQHPFHADDAQHWLQDALNTAEQLEDPRPRDWVI